MMNILYTQDTQILYRSIDKAVSVLDNNELVIVPSETVFGLAGNIYSSQAIDKIFEVKNRPKDNPLICHIYSLEQVVEIAIIPENIRTIYQQLVEQFWPGPLTLILNKKVNPQKINYASINMETVAIRMPSHPVFRLLLEKLNYPLAAPSANISGRPSGTVLEDIVNEFKEGVHYILEDSNKNKNIGIESTVLDLTIQPFTILRTGAITKEDIEDLLKMPITLVNKHIDTTVVKSPGQKYKHYSPKFPVYLFSSVDTLIPCIQNSRKKAFVFHNTKYQECLEYYGKIIIQNEKELMQSLYHMLYELERDGYEELWVQEYSYDGISAALMERLLKIRGGI